MACAYRRFETVALTLGASNVSQKQGLSPDGSGVMAAEPRPSINFERNVTKQGVSRDVPTHNIRIVVFSTRSENRKAKNASPANVLVTESTSQLQARLPFPSRDATEVTLASLNIKAILALRKATFLSNFTAKQPSKAPAEISFSLEESQRFSMRGLYRPP